MAQGDGLHVKEADVHLGLDVDALPDLKHGRSGVSGHPRSPRPPATPRPPTSTAHRDAPTGEIQSEAWNLFHLPLCGLTGLTFGFFWTVTASYYLSAESRLLAEVARIPPTTTSDSVIFTQIPEPLGQTSFAPERRGDHHLCCPLCGGGSRGFLHGSGL